MVSEQVFRMLLDQEYTRASRLLETHSDLLPVSPEVESLTATSQPLVGQTEQKSPYAGSEEPEALD